MRAAPGACYGTCGQFDGLQYSIRQQLTTNCSLTRNQILRRNVNLFVVRHVMEMHDGTGIRHAEEAYLLQRIEQIVEIHQRDA